MTLEQLNIGKNVWYLTVYKNPTLTFYFTCLQVALCVYHTLYHIKIYTDWTYLAKRENLNAKKGQSYLPLLGV